MSIQRVRRRWLDFFITLAMTYAMIYAGAGAWSLLVVPYGLWNFWDGATRGDLP